MKRRNPAPVNLDRPIRPKQTVGEEYAHLRDVLVGRDDHCHSHVPAGIVVHLRQRDLQQISRDV